MEILQQKSGKNGKISIIISVKDLKSQGVKSKELDEALKKERRIAEKALGNISICSVIFIYINLKKE